MNKRESVNYIQTHKRTCQLRYCKGNIELVLKIVIMNFYHIMLIFCFQLVYTYIYC